ncbi:MAG: hypothetical protein ACKOPT_13635 [Cyanobium sp.]
MADELTDRELALAYFHRFERVILDRLRIAQAAETLTEDDRVGLASAYLDIASS